MSSLSTAPVDSIDGDEAERLTQLLAPLRLAVSSNCIVIAQGLWEVFNYVALFPGMLHGLWCDEVRTLGLNASYAILPFSQTDWSVVQRPMFIADTVHQARKRARWCRHLENRSQLTDFEHPDWEVGYGQRRDELSDRRLSVSSFLSFETIQPAGHAKRHPRPILGRHAGRGSRQSMSTPPHPRVLIPSQRCYTHPNSEEAVKILAETDIVVINLQQLYGNRVLGFARSVLEARGPRRPTLIVSSRPSELAFLNYLPLLRQATAIPIGRTLVVPEVEVVPIGRERPQREREYDIVLRELKGQSDHHDYIANLGVAAWWTANESVAVDSINESAVRRFMSALERTAGTNRDIAADFAAFRRLLVEVVNDDERIAERKDAIDQLVLRHINGGAGPVCIIARTMASLRAIAESLCGSLDCTTDELADWDVYLTTANRLLTKKPISLAIAVGFSGISTLDALVGTRADRAVLVIDPIEAALAVNSVEKLVPWISLTGESTAGAKAIGNGTLPFAIQTASMAAISIDINYRAVRPPDMLTMSYDRNISPEIVLSLLDGSELIVDAEQLFDRLDPRTGIIRRVRAETLQSGDEIVLIDGASEFSDHLRRVLDETVLAPQARLRQTWVILIETVVTQKRLKKTWIRRELSDQGVNVDYQTVLGWTSSRVHGERVPARWQHFCALAEVVGLNLSELQLREFFDAVRILRIQHRKAGRDVVRTLRAARTGQLSPITLRQIENRYGFSVRDLVAASRVVTIDDIWKEV